MSCSEAAVAEAAKLMLSNNSFSAVEKPSPSVSITPTVTPREYALQQQVYDNIFRNQSTPLHAPANSSAGTAPGPPEATAPGGQIGRPNNISPADQSQAASSKPFSVVSHGTLSVVSHGEGCVCRGRLTQEVCGKIRQRFNKN